MKILELRFKNINSLYGEWRIDFTDPNFTMDGLFAITGPTGSGKTTILDAICLALYGETPRLGKMTQSDNEVMSRQTGECSAEVLFKTAQGSFRATWQQHRSRKKAGGALQAPKREIAKADGTILAEKLKDVQEQVERITGMDFYRFTRSILLAQGSFDTFLKANADERSPILEQITGTEIYTEISKAVHLRNSTENQTLNELKAGLGGIHLLNAEELEQIELNLKQVEETHRIEAKKRDSIRAALDGIQRMQTLEQELETNREEQESWRVENEKFLPQATRLETAKRARPLDIDHARLINLRNDRLKATTQWTAANEALPEQEKQFATDTQKLETATRQLEQRDQEFQNLTPILKQVRALDTTITERATALKKEETDLEKSQNELRALQAKRNSNQTLLEQQRAGLSEVETYQKSHAQDAELVGQLAAIFQSIEQLDKLKSEKSHANTAAEQCISEAKKTFETARLATEKLKCAQEQFSRSDAGFKCITNRLETALAGKTNSEWITLLSELTRRFKIEQSISDNRKKWIHKTEETKDTASALDKKQTEQQALQREQDLLLQNLKLRQKIESLELERGDLAEGQPCPLCGALHHPYASALPEPETGSIDKNKAALTALAEQINQLTRRHSAAESACATLQETLEQDENELKSLPSGTREEANQITERIQQIQTFELKQKEKRAALDDAREALTRQQLAEQEAKQKSTASTEKSDQAIVHAAEIRTAFESAESALFHALKPYGIQFLNDAKKLLKTRCDDWVAAEKKRIDFKQASESLRTAISNQAEQIETRELRSAEQTDAFKEKSDALNQLVADRQAQFGDQHPDTVEDDAQSKLTTARRTYDDAQHAQHQSEKTLSTALEKIETLEKTQQECQQKLDEQEPLFFHALETAGFESEDAYLSARLSESVQAELEKQAGELNQRHTRLAALEAEKVQHLQAERDREHPETSPEEYAELTESCNGLQQQIGQFKSQLTTNEKAKELLSEKIETIQKQQAECARWNQLHELIGSADGKKFRNFAQGLTFELMVSHANQQLAKMSDRYLLIRDKNKPLDLNVIDNYQAGETRPVKNLSGGESFIVSLSLALGLSKMASKTIRVDSLFLDEGFGTLDEEALETALEALSELKQDGKIIGVISHVSAMKERIGTQINVHATSGGRSRLSGAGVSNP